MTDTGGSGNIGGVNDNTDPIESFADAWNTAGVAPSPELIGPRPGVIGYAIVEAGVYHHRVRISPPVLATALHTAVEMAKTEEGLGDGPDGYHRYVIYEHAVGGEVRRVGRVRSELVNDKDLRAGITGRIVYISADDSTATPIHIGDH